MKTILIEMCIELKVKVPDNYTTEAIKAAGKEALRKQFKKNGSAKMVEKFSGMIIKEG